MEKFVFLVASAVFLSAMPGQSGFEKDVFKTSAGELEITFIGHGTLMMKFAGKTIHIDPWSRLADYGKLPKADIILVTHQHGDHLDMKAIEQIRTPGTVLLLTQKCADEAHLGKVLKNGDVNIVFGIRIEAVAAYNIVHKRPDGGLFHPRGEGNGYILTFGRTRVYVAGDTENTQEMKALKDIDIAFLPMNLPYTMTPEMVADAAASFKPKILYPYHTGDTDVKLLQPLLRGDKGIEIRVRRMQ